MKKVALGVALAASLSACATNPYDTTTPITATTTTRPAARRRALRLARPAAPRSVQLSGREPRPGRRCRRSTCGVLGAVIKGKQYYRDTRGYCYYVDQYGRPVYDYNTRC